MNFPRKWPNRVPLTTGPMTPTEGSTYVHYATRPTARFQTLTRLLMTRNSRGKWWLKGKVALVRKPETWKDDGVECLGHLQSVDRSEGVLKGNFEKAGRGYLQNQQLINGLSPRKLCAWKLPQGCDVFIWELQRGTPGKFPKTQKGLVRGQHGRNFLDCCKMELGFVRASNK